MHLSNERVTEILQLYDLGSLKSMSYIGSGYVNYNFDLKTSKGDFIVQIIGDTFNKWKKGKMRLEFKLLHYLKKNDFPYKIPIPLKNVKGKYLTNLHDYHLWVYKKIEGKIYSKYTLAQFKEVAKALAIYHNYVEPFKCDEDDFFDFKWLLKEYEKLQNIKPKNEEDRIVLKYARFFEEIVRKLEEVDFKEDLLVTHSDFNNDNLIFQGNKLVGIIDFDNLELAPSAKDIAIAIKRSNYIKRGYTIRKATLFMKEYEKYRHLSQKTKELIIPALLKDNCGLFLWLYAGLKKHTKGRSKMLLDVVKETRRLYNLVRNKKLD